MQGEKFRAIMAEELQALIAMNQNKGADYAGEDDALGFFKAMAREAGLTEEQVWAVLARKHWAAILAFVRHGHDDGYQPSEEIRGRILDLILYLFLLLALVREEKDDGDLDAPESVRDDSPSETQQLAVLCLVANWTENPWNDRVGEEAWDWAYRRNLADQSADQSGEQIPHLTPRGEAYLQELLNA